MSEEHRNIYKICRKVAGFTQEAAAERLDISVESIRAYETGQRIPSNEVVEGMSILYNDLRLPFKHLRETNALYGRIVPQVDERSLMEAALRIHNRLSRIEQHGSLDRLLEIAEDNIIDDAERPEFMAIVAELREIVRGALELQLHCPDGEVGPCA